MADASPRRVVVTVPAASSSFGGDTHSIWDSMSTPGGVCAALSLGTSSRGLDRRELERREALLRTVPKFSHLDRDALRGLAINLGSEYRGNGPSTRVNTARPARRPTSRRVRVPDAGLVKANTAGEPRQQTARRCAHDKPTAAQSKGPVDPKPVANTSAWLMRGHPGADFSRYASTERSPPSRSQRGRESARKPGSPRAAWAKPPTAKGRAKPKTTPARAPDSTRSPRQRQNVIRAKSLDAEIANKEAGRQSVKVFRARSLDEQAQQQRKDQARQRKSQAQQQPMNSPIFMPLSSPVSLFACPNNNRRNPPLANALVVYTAPNPGQRVTKAERWWGSDPSDSGTLRCCGGTTFKKAVSARTNTTDINDG